jgi:hypothetical protein
MGVDWEWTKIVLFLYKKKSLDRKQINFFKRIILNSIPIYHRQAASSKRWFHENGVLWYKDVKSKSKVFIATAVNKYNV